MDKRPTLLRVLCLGLLLVLPALAQAQPCRLDSLAWLLGTWESADQKSRETWSRVSPRTFEGLGIVTNKNAPPSTESLRLVEMGASVFYIAKVKHNALPVAFAATECSSTHALFENTSHDFPKRLRYHAPAPEALSVDVDDGQGQGFTIQYHRRGAPTVDQ